jgi:hypothetical protein
LPVSFARCAGSVEAGADRGTPGNPPPRAGVRGSDATCGGGSEDEAGGADVVRSERRGAGPCQSQIERPDSGAAPLDPVANAGWRPGAGAAMNDDPLAWADSSAVDAAACAVSSGSGTPFIASLPASLSSLPAGASAGLPSWPR